ncbi:hypothetical protein MA16_Dca011667 [Dendrobium catenatum]|uniref:Uncharacterized protein n=1 Tax=Dendrobium catenatum TaxID=906689 RepID=A0A2I0WY06_9ASPA|nr:hypothetical protein MA16_Dca011667 [Dendrobium catenatum]
MLHKKEKTKTNYQLSCLRNGKIQLNQTRIAKTNIKTGNRHQTKKFPSLEILDSEKN